MKDSLVKKILDARIYDLVIETPLTKAVGLSTRFSRPIYLKREDLQPVHSFKLRGAYNKLLQLPAEVLAKGVIAASAGNHAQGLAMAATHMGIAATIVMPQTTPQIKIDGVRTRGANVVLHGDSFDQAAGHAKELSERQGLFYVHPFDDLDVIAGQGTAAVEILKQMPAQVEAIFLPVGGGGLAAGCANWIKFLRPEIKVIAVEPEDAACLRYALEQGAPATLDKVGLFADGVAVARIGEVTFELLKDTVDEVITCTTDEICAAIKDIFDDTRSIAEPAGALSLAGLKKYAEHANTSEGALIAIESGANTNFDRLRYISERTEIGEQREAVFAVTIPEQPGSFAAFCENLGKRAVTEFNYRYNRADQAVVFVGVQVRAGGDDRAQLNSHLVNCSYPVVDLTDNELAKVHTRYMVGGVSQLPNERVFRTRFPERPGALKDFLSALGGEWSITLFHYRNHGAAYGRVLFGLAIDETEVDTLTAKLAQVGFSIEDETANPAFQLFMS
ncbi:threonine ammonia-lyase, biosynthetic [Umboniibacter marinipuniceus]|uniref:L-threonine dehydratase n=1 Tax=Umboniibacter marinipuniceus TaxID=569599 RepID=A0A3M0ABS2_9GAMM|nr:threonine ammonia-lyase, biosynthetic [Umboniibacter marinipuniceus]RMA80228.1 L-threonine ammonia-lyase [Umboniibacter marinipuniceus]